VRWYLEWTRVFSFLIVPRILGTASRTGNAKHSTGLPINPQPVPHPYVRANVVQMVPMSSQPQSSTQEVLAGLVERVTFHNAENEFCVLRAKARGHRDFVTVVGHAATIAAGLRRNGPSGSGNFSLHVRAWCRRAGLAKLASLARRASETASRYAISTSRARRSIRRPSFS
jgi:hypothetical protein